MRHSFSAEPGLGAQVFDLLDVVFPGVRRGAREAKRLGGDWEAVSTPFVHFEGGQAVSHVGVIELSLILIGRVVSVGTVHAVATHPEHRRRGHYRRVMDELEHAATRYETLILTTEHPEYFEPFGFRHVQEHLLTVRAASPGTSGDLRLLDMNDERDISLLGRLLATREPVSRVVGVFDDKAVFCFNEGRRPLHYSEDLDVVLCLEREGARLALFDVVGLAVPSLEALLARIPGPVEEVAIHFAVDRLGADAEATPYLLDHDGPSHLMVRGPFAAENEPFTLPRSART